MSLPDLAGKSGLVLGIANANSIAYGCAKAFHAAGAELAITYLDATAEPYVRPLAEKLDSPIIVPCDVREPGQLDAVFERVRQEWGRLDFLLHSIAYAPTEDLHARVVDCSRAGFLVAMDVSCHSFIRMAKLAEPLMKDGGCLLTVTCRKRRRRSNRLNPRWPGKRTFCSGLISRRETSSSCSSAISPRRRARVSCSALAF